MKSGRPRECVNDKPPRLSVLRLGHRRERDKRITSHLGLTARAFGADEVILAGEEDPGALETWNSVTSRFGGDFECRYEAKPLSWLRRFVQDSGDGEAGTLVHLTMYGEPLRKAIIKIDTSKPILVVVGGTKVPGEVFRLATHNISIGNQPHSEVAALAVFLDSFVGPLDDAEHFAGGEIRVVPSADRKRVVTAAEE
ncbi:MAG TPA: tRNA (cytidine(56)-2'-O)-methyltransferase [Candidatus Poseidoniales archaeon]|nr:tRNA (cytidine(56)-2'-O)-methyltransferase [Candidatus Poseidoniales archaeon]